MFLFEPGLLTDISAEGITPVAEHERMDKQFSKIFFIFLSANFNILS